MAKPSKNGNYPVRKGSRLDRLSCTWVYNRVIAAMEDRARELGDNGWRQDELLGTGLRSQEIIEQYARIVVYTDREQQQSLETMNGKSFLVPERQCSDGELLAGYQNWLATDEKLLDAIDADICVLNDSPAPSWMVPPEQVTEEQKQDPNS